MMEQVFDGVGNLCKVGCSLLKRKTRPLGGYLDVGGGVPFQAVSLAGITRPDRVESATKSHPAPSIRSKQVSGEKRALICVNYDSSYSFSVPVKKAPG